MGCRVCTLENYLQSGKDYHPVAGMGALVCVTTSTNTPKNVYVSE